MSRSEKILRFVNKFMRGIEIAPYHFPLAAKRDGFNCLTLDIFDGPTLRKMAEADPNIDKADLIEDVDIVASALELDVELEKQGMLGTFEYILSSHNFEHLPDPIKFLRACGRALKPMGTLTMAIPDKRHTFDIARSLSTTSDFLEAFHTQRSQPTPRQIFDCNQLHVSGQGAEAKYSNSLRDTYKRYLTQISSASNPYEDTHVSTFTATSFGSIITDCILLELIPFVIIDVESNGFEFYAHMKNVGYENLKQYEKANFENRNSLMLRAFAIG